MLTTGQPVLISAWAGKAPRTSRASRAGLPIEIDREGAPLPGLLALALRYGWSSYGAACLAWALRRQLPLATRDADLRAAAQQGRHGRRHPAEAD
jgi:hypothetical protein